LFLHYPDDPAFYAVQDQYLYGAELLVAPVIKESTVSRSVILPGEGEWTHAFTGATYAVGTHNVAAPIGTPPVFYRADSAFAPLFAGLAAA
jgi:alpha-glucosidase